MSGVFDYDIKSDSWILYIEIPKDHGNLIFINSDAERYYYKQRMIDEITKLFSEPTDRAYKK